jgi:hypothetical protein
MRDTPYGVPVPGIVGEYPAPDQAAIAHKIDKIHDFCTVQA